MLHCKPKLVFIISKLLTKEQHKTNFCQKLCAKQNLKIPKNFKINEEVRLKMESK